MVINTLTMNTFLFNVPVKLKVINEKSRKLASARRSAKSGDTVPATMSKPRGYAGELQK